MITIFYMWGTRREGLIAEHQFYVSEGKKRLTNQFSDKAAIEQEATAFGEAWLKRAGRHFNPDRHDVGSFYEQAQDEEIQHYAALDELGNSARLALIAGMYHYWERSLREWLTSRDCTGHFHKGDHLPRAIWGAGFFPVLELFQCIGLFQAGCTIRDRLDTCRMVVNTYKHGAGSSADQLKAKRPELFDQYGLRAKSTLVNYAALTDYTDLYVEDAQIDEFADAIEEFWRAIPEYVTDSEFQPVPKWFIKAYNKDCEKA